MRLLYCSSLSWVYLPSNVSLCLEEVKIYLTNCSNHLGIAGRRHFLLVVAVGLSSNICSFPPLKFLLQKNFWIGITLSYYKLSIHIYFINQNIASSFFLKKYKFKSDHEWLKWTRKFSDSIILRVVSRWSGPQKTKCSKNKCHEEDA